MYRTTAILAATLLGLGAPALAADFPMAAQPEPYVKAPAQAVPPVSGYLGLYVGASATRIEPLDVAFKDTLFVFGGHGRVNAWTAPNALIQFDVEAEGTTAFEQGCCAAPGGRLSGAFGAHFSFADPERYSGGVLLGLLAHDNPGALLGATGTSALGLVGLEGQMYLGNFTLYGQGGYAGRFSGPSVGPFDIGPDDLWFVRGVARYYLTPMDKLEAEIGYADLSYAGPVEGEILNWGATYEHQIAGSPWSWYAEYAGYKTDTTAYGFIGSKTTEHVGMIGARLHFNQDNLLSQERTGARYDMPKFLRGLPFAVSLPSVL